MIDPKKLGRVMWSRNEHGTMSPHDLNGTLSERDAENLSKVFESLLAYRKIGPAVHTIRSRRWDNMVAIKPYLMDTMIPRSEARDLIRSGDWDPLWSSID